MWIAYTKEQTFNEAASTWPEAKKHDIIALECHYAGKTEKIFIPDGCDPVVFNTGTIVLGGRVKQLSQAIGWSDGEKEYYIRISNDGEKTTEVGEVVH